MARPVVAVVGRPNVGKSTLFNKLIGRRLSIVKDTPGVTRDRIFAECEWSGRRFMLADTGGIEPYSDDVILSQMRRQAQLAIDQADVIVLVTDLRSGVTANDADVAVMLQKSGKPVVLCVNKCDTVGDPPPEFYEFYNLGLGDPVAVSSVHGHGTGDLLDAVCEYLPEDDGEEEESDTIKVAVIGKPNAGNPPSSTGSRERNGRSCRISPAPPGTRWIPPSIISTGILSLSTPPGSAGGAGWTTRSKNTACSAPRWRWSGPTSA